MKDTAITTLREQTLVFTIVRPQMTFNSRSFFFLLECLWFLWDSCEVKTHIGRQEDVLGHLGAYLSNVITNMKKGQ